MSIKVTDSAGTEVPLGKPEPQIGLFIDKWFKHSTPGEMSAEDTARGEVLNSIIVTSMDAGDDLNKALAKALKASPEFETMLDLLGFLMRTGYLRPVNPEGLKPQERPDGLIDMNVRFEFERKENGT